MKSWKPWHVFGFAVRVPDTAAVRERPFEPRLVRSIELTKPTPDYCGLHGYAKVRALVRIRGVPIGLVEQPIIDGRCSGRSLRRAALNELQWPIMRHLLMEGLASGYPTDGFDVSRFEAVLSRPASPPPDRPTVSVVVCTRDRTEHLARCLDSLIALQPAADEILVIDNAPASGATAALVARYPVRYVCEPEPGLDRARTRGAAESRSDIIAYTDDDVAVDAGWIAALRRAFANEAVDAVTGLVLPLELETPAQALFERYGGFGRGFLRRWYRLDVAGGESPVVHAGAGKFGTGANMAFRRRVLEHLGGFDPALDVGTPTNGGGDLDMYYRVLRAGGTLVYEPNAIVLHEHRPTYQQLREQLANHGIGFYAYLTGAAMRDWRDAAALALFGARWFVRWDIKRLLQTWFKPGMYPRDLVLAELNGSLRGPLRLMRARRAARRRPLPAGWQPNDCPLDTRRLRTATARFVVDVRCPVEGFAAASDAREVIVEIVRGSERLGAVTVANRGVPLTAERVRQAIVEEVAIDVLGGRDAPAADRFRRFEAALRALFPDAERPSARRLHTGETVSIVIATRDRAEDLERALTSITRLKKERPVEVVVVDNNPRSGQTPAVTARFPGVQLVSEPRPGLSYARNSGILAARGSIVVATDDDVVVPPDWLETLIAPFGDPEVMAVTGNVLPNGIESASAKLFEAYGGLGRGTERLRVDGVWFRDFRRAVPTWRLGGTANAAFRASIFRHPAIGLLDESLGAGTPAGCSEDTDLFYRILRAGYRIVYEPAAVVQHRHRTTMRALRRQIYAYAKGHVAYQLTTLKRDRDLRALVRLGCELPDLYWWRVRTRLSGASDYPLSLVAVEIAGLAAGPWAWWRSRRRVRRLGATAPSSPGRLTCSTS